MDAAVSIKFVFKANNQTFTDERLIDLEKYQADPEGYTEQVKSAWKYARYAAARSLSGLDQLPIISPSTPEA